jgi:hypothetical protein
MHSWDVDIGGGGGVGFWATGVYVGMDEVVWGDTVGLMGPIPW